MPKRRRSTGPYESGIPELIMKWLAQASPADALIFIEVVEQLVAVELDSRVAL